MHIGHSVVFSLSHLYCREYEGKLVLRVEDTNPESIYEPAYKMIEEDSSTIKEYCHLEQIILRISSRHMLKTC